MEHYFTSNEDLKSELRVIKYDYESYNFIFYSDLGVFSKDHIDYGSKFLLESFLCTDKSENPKVLDMGCGYGYIGIVLSKVITADVDMCDVNKRAIHLAERNIKENSVEANVFESNIYENINNKYDYIITNPPIRAGKQIILDILFGAKKHLNESGELWFVIRKDHGAKSIVKTLEKDYLCQIIAKSKGFYVIKAQIK